MLMHAHRQAREWLQLEADCVAYEAATVELSGTSDGCSEELIAQRMRLLQWILVVRMVVYYADGACMDVVNKSSGHSGGVDVEKQDGKVG